MTDREKLIELLCKSTQKTEICSNETFRDCRTAQGDCGYCTILADHLLANGVTVQKWIPVTERLPIQGETVLAWAAPFVSKAWRNEKGDWVTTHGPAASLKPVTHWMPMPEPPKNGGADPERS